MSTHPRGASVSLRSVSHRYSGSGTVLDKISLEVKAGEFVSILGPSGCGKSTLLRFIAALEHPTEGTIVFNSGGGNCVRGFVFQEPRLLPWLTVLENVRLPLALKGVNKKDSMEKAIATIDRVGLKDALSRFPAQLSGGMKMRVSVARALILEPTLLLLDEPFAALDETIRNSLQEELRALWQSLKMTVIFVTHSIPEAVYLSERTIVLSKSPARILTDERLNLPQERTMDLRLSSAFTSEIQRLSKFISLKAVEE